MNKPKILLFDIETAPSLGYYFELYKEGNIVSKVSNWYILTFAYKWLDQKTTHVYKLSDFKTYKKNKTDDKELVTKLWELFNEADIIIAHNGDQFDIKKSNAKFIQHGLTPPSPYKTIDTKKVAKRYFKFDSNKLDDLGDYLKIGRKLQTGGFELWLGCMSGDKKSWNKMAKYNIQDVVLLEKVYEKLKPWMTNHPNMNLFNKEHHNCPVCNSTHIQKRGFNRTRSSIKQAYQCIDCGAWSQGENIKIDYSLLK